MNVIHSAALAANTKFVAGLGMTVFTGLATWFGSDPTRLIDLSHGIEQRNPSAFVPVLAAAFSAIAMYLGRPVTVTDAPPAPPQPIVQPVLAVVNNTAVEPKTEA